MFCELEKEIDENECKFLDVLISDMDLYLVVSCGKKRLKKIIGSLLLVMSSSSSSLSILP